MIPNKIDENSNCTVSVSLIGCSKEINFTEVANKLFQQYFCHHSIELIKNLSRIFSHALKGFTDEIKEGSVTEKITSYTLVSAGWVIYSMVRNLFDLLKIIMI